MTTSARAARVCFSVILGLAAATVALPARHGETPAAGPEQIRLRELLVRFDETQSATRTLTASFVERKELAMLKEPLVSKGRFFYTKPDDVLWQYVEPDPRYFLISKNELLSYFPKKKKAERVSISMYHDRLLKVLAIGQASDTLMKYYDIRLEEKGNDVAGTLLLVLEPRKRSVKKRIQEVRLWISKDRALPVRMQYREPDGDTTTISFEDVRFNPDIAASTYRLDIPKDVEVHKGFSGMNQAAEKDQG